MQPEEGRILDSASAALAEVREARRANRADLRAEMERWARQLHSQGVSERPQVVVRRDRLCIPVRAGRQGELPKGSVSLAISSTGNTLYMEPQVGDGHAGSDWQGPASVEG
jgi:dsDNA-specific endonuclease/ATPase MutS2